MWARALSKTGSSFDLGKEFQPAYSSKGSRRSRPGSRKRLLPLRACARVMQALCTSMLDLVDLLHNKALPPPRPPPSSSCTTRMPWMPRVLFPGLCLETDSRSSFGGVSAFAGGSGPGRGRGILMCRFFCCLRRSGFRFPLLKLQPALGSALSSCNCDCLCPSKYSVC